MNSNEADVTVGTPVTVRLHLTSGGTRNFVAFPVRKGWHCAPPCNTTQPVYATPEDAAYAHNWQNAPLGAQCNSDVIDAEIV